MCGVLDGLFNLELAESNRVLVLMKQVTDRVRGAQH